VGSKWAGMKEGGGEIDCEENTSQQILKHQGKRANSSRVLEGTLRERGEIGKVMKPEKTSCPL